MAEPPAPHIALVGLMGSGKSSAGARVAERLGRRFVDADDELVRRTGRSVRDWFEQEGEGAFRAAEADVLATLLDDPAPSVVACGGGVVVTEANRARLRAGHVLVVWLRGSPAFLASRVKQKGHRPLLDGDAERTLDRLHAERLAWYEEVADVVVDVEPSLGSGDKPKRRLADAIVAAVADRVPVP